MILLGNILRKKVSNNHYLIGIPCSQTMAGKTQKLLFVTMVSSHHSLPPPPPRSPHSLPTSEKQ